MKKVGGTGSAGDEQKNHFRLWQKTTALVPQHRCTTAGIMYLFSFTWQVCWPLYLWRPLGFFWPQSGPPAATLASLPPGGQVWTPPGSAASWHWPPWGACRQGSLPEWRTFQLQAAGLTSIELDTRVADPDPVGSLWFCRTRISKKNHRSRSEIQFR